MSLGRQSLRTRLLVGALSTTILSLWAVTIVIGSYLRQDMEAAISAQQFSTVSLIAAEIDRSVRERLTALQESTRWLSANDRFEAKEIQSFIETKAALLSLFNWGIIVTDADGTAIASAPESLGRTGIRYGDLAPVRHALESGTVQILEPIVGIRTGVPVLTMVVPIKNAKGKLIGAMMGATNLDRPNFLDELSASKYGHTGDFLLTAPKSRLFIASSDKSRVMKPGPKPGINPVYDRYIDGVEGSGVAVSSRGVEELSSSKRVPSTGWLMQSVLPTEEAFAPVRAIQRHLIVVSLLLSLLAGSGAWWWLRHQLSPLEEASRLLDRMRAGDLPRQPLPVYHDDEIGRLAVAFNGLLAAIADQEAMAAEYAANQRLRKILSHVPGMVFQYRLHADGTGSFPFASDAVRSIYEVAPEEVETNAGKIRAMAHPDDTQQLFASLHASADTLCPWTAEYRIVTPSGRLKWLRVDAAPEKNEDGLTAWYGFVTDISATKAMEAELRIAAVTFDSQEGILITDGDGFILRVNKAFSRITGYTNEQVVGRTPLFLKSDRHETGFLRKLHVTLMLEGGWQGEIWNRRRSGEVFPAWVSVSAVKDPAGKVTHFVAAFTDITEHKEAEEKIYHLAFFDPLTDLPNRRLLIDRIRQALAASQRNRQYGAVIFLDLDHFKMLNDTKGHDLGDQLLIQTARRLSAGVRESDTVARLGGDEFVIVMQELGEEAGNAAAVVETVAQKLRESINRPYDLDGYQHRLTASFGVTLFLEKEPGVEVLLKQADMALYEAKGAGRDAIRFFDPTMQKQLDDRARLEAGLRDALRLGRLVLYYQPQVDADGRLLGAEALIRWQEPDGRLIPPGEFIPLAEETGLILPLGEWVLETTAALLQEWARDAALAKLVLSINLSAQQFSQPNFVNQVSETIARHGVRNGMWQMELTESVVLGNVEEVIDRMKALKRLGVTFSLDDFGTGYSSLSYLRRLPIDQIKIDREFIRDVAHDPDDAAIVEAIIGLGSTLDLPVVAEGVETEEQRRFLREHVCQTYQGYLFGRPMPIAEFEELARRTAASSARNGDQ